MDSETCQNGSAAFNFQSYYQQVDSMTGNCKNPQSQVELMNKITSQMCYLSSKTKNE